MESRHGIILDTNIFNRLVDNLASIDIFDGWPLYATHIQLAELKNTKNKEGNSRRENLLTKFAAVGPEILPTRSFAIGVSAIGQAGISDGKIYGKVLFAVETNDAKHGKRKRKGSANQIRDALIGEVAIESRLLLITEDEGLREAVRDLGGSALSIQEFDAMRGGGA